MSTRREFLAAAAMTATASTLSPLAASAQDTPDSSARSSPDDRHYRIPHRLGLGGVAIGNGFAPLPAVQSDAVLQAAWDAGVRYFDTSPWYGLGLSERRMGHVFHGKPRDEYVVSTKIGRLLVPTGDVPETMWKQPSPFAYRYDYTADGTRRSIEDSLQRLGLSRIDVAFIHDLSPDNGDMKDKWTEHFDVAAKGAMPALTKMREEGIIKGWGMGVNTIEPCLRALEAADPDVFLSATKYSIVEHEDALRRLLPACEKRGVWIVSGAPLNSGFLAGRERYNYSRNIPPEIQTRARRIAALAREHDTDLRTAALQFCAAPRIVCSVIPGASTAQQVKENVASMNAEIPGKFWSALKREKLIHPDAPTPS